MSEFDDFESGQDGTVFRDVLMLALLGFMVIVVVLLPHLNPPTKAAASDPPGNIIVEVRWPDDIDVDVDLWVKGPTSRPIGYSNQSGPLFNLLRDDLGRASDATGLNYEIAYSRGVESGEYIVNLHLYRSNVELPISATVVVKVKRTPDEAAERLFASEVPLRRVGEELTVTRFVLDEEGRLVPDSVHDMPQALRAAG